MNEKVKSKQPFHMKDTIIKFSSIATPKKQKRNLCLKISEKDYIELQTLVKKSVDEINDLLLLHKFQKPINSVIRKKRQSHSFSKYFKKFNTETGLLNDSSNINNKNENSPYNFNNIINISNKHKKSNTRSLEEKGFSILDKINISHIKEINKNSNKHILNSKLENIKKLDIIKKNNSNSSSINKKCLSIKKDKNIISSSNVINKMTRECITVDRKQKKIQPYCCKNKIEISTNRAKNKTYIEIEKEKSIEKIKMSSISTTINSSTSSPHNKNFLYTTINYNNSTISPSLNNETYHTIINKIFSKEFPYNSINTNDILKLILLLNEYLINNNILKDFYLQKNKPILDDLSKYLSDNIVIDYPEENDIDHSKLDKVVHSIKKIQRAWRKEKIHKFLGNKNKEDNEMKKMILTNYLAKKGSRMKKVLRLFCSLVEEFSIINNDNDTHEMFNYIIKLIQGKLTQYEKNIIYKEYINNKILG